MTKTVNTTTIEEALSMYRETVSPHSNRLVEILSQIPENKPEGRRAVRSPYTWILVTQVMAISVILVAVFPTLKVLGYDYEKDSVALELQLDSFNASIDNEDYQNSINDYSL
jgi:hypothetical protein